MVQFFLNFRTLILLSRTLWENKVPFIYCHCIGLVAWIRVQLNEHTVIESHPDNVIDDLRLDDPFPELVDHMNNISMTNREEVIKLPWLVLLYKGIEAYMEEGEDKVNKNETKTAMDTFAKIHPSRMNSRQKQEFKRFLKRCKFYQH